MSIEFILDGIRMGAIASAEWHVAARPRRLARVGEAIRKRDLYLAARDTARPCDPLHHRADALARWQGHLAAAWRALADGDAITARAHDKAAWRAFAEAKGIRVGFSL